MKYFPAFRKVSNTSDLDRFASHYLHCSGFDVPQAYFTANQVFVVLWRGQMIAGFVLGAGDSLRTLEVFAGEAHRAALYEQVQSLGQSTEMCCFWIAPEFRKNTWINYFVWVCVAYALQAYGHRRLLFGTNSLRLAQLYSAASESELLHTDFLHRKRTFIFVGPRKHCLLGVAQILWYKTKRLLRLSLHRTEAPARTPFLGAN